MASVIPKSKNSTLAPSLAPSISLFIVPNPFLSVSVSQSNRRLSSERRTLCVPGTLTRQLPLLLDKLQVPELPSLNDNVTGTVGSLTIVAQDVRRKIDASNNKDFMRLPFLMLIGIATLFRYRYKRGQNE